MDNNNYHSSSSNSTSQGHYSSLSPNPSTMILPSLSAMRLPDQIAHTTIPSQTTAVPNATNTNTNTNYTPDFSPAALLALTSNPNLASIPPTLQDTPMLMPMPMSMSNHSSMNPSPCTTSNYLPTNNGPLLASDFIPQWQGNHINRLGHNNDLTTYDGSNASFPLDLNLIANSGITWPGMPQLTQAYTAQIPMTTNNNEYQAFDINSLPLPSVPVDHHQHQQKDMLCLLNRPGFGTHGTSGGQRSETLVAPYASSDPGPSSLFLQQQQQRAPILASQRTPDLASQQHLPPPRLQQQLNYFPTMTVNNNSNSNSNNSTHPFDSSSSSSAIAQHNVPHQRHPHQQQQPYKPPEMYHFYETVHTHLQEQERQHQQQEQQQLQLQLQQLESQMVYSQGDTATSALASMVPVPSSQNASSSSAHVPPPNQVSAYDPHSWKRNPNATFTAPASSGSPASPEADLSSRPSSTGASTPQATLIPGPGHTQQISTGRDDISDEHILLVEKQPLATAMDVKDFQPQFQNLKQTQTQTQNQQLFQEQLDKLLMEQAQALAQSYPQVPAQTQAQAQVQTQVQAQVASPQECAENGDSPMEESDVSTRPTLYPGAIHQEQLRNYRGYRHYSYDQNGAPQPVLSNQGGNSFSSSSSPSLSSSLSTQQQQPAVAQKQLVTGLPLPQMDSSHNSPTIGHGIEQSLTQKQIQAPPLQVDVSHGSLEAGTSTGITTPQSSLAAQAYIQLALTAGPSASASAASSIVGTPTEFNNIQSSSNLLASNNSSNEQQQLSNNHNNDNGTLNIVGTNNRRLTHLPPPFPQEQDTYYGFSFEPMEGFTRRSSWPCLVSGVPLTTASTANRMADQEMKEFLDSVSGDIKYATAQLELYGGMSISDAFLSSKVDPRLGLTTGFSGTGTGGGVVNPKIQPGDDVVVVVKREKKLMLDMDFEVVSAATTANGDEGKGADRESANIPVTVRRAAAVAARAAAIAARESTINDYINLNLNFDAQGGNRNGHGHNRRSRDNIVAGQDGIVAVGQGNNNRSNSSERPHPHHHHESAADVNDAGDEEYIPLPPLSPTPPPPTRPAPTPASRQNTRSRVSKKGAIQKTSPSPEPTVFKCEIPHCEKEFSTYGLLKSHKVSHDPEKPYWCDICSEDGITPRPADPTPLFPGMPIPIPEVKKYKRHHDLLRHRREQHPPLAVKIQRFREKLEAKEARKVKTEEARKVKAALKRAEKAAAQAANPTVASRRRTSSVAVTTATAAPRSRRASSTTATIATTETVPVVAALAVQEAPKTLRKRKLTKTKRSTTNDDDDDEADNDNDNDSDYQENTKKRCRFKTSSISRTAPATPRRRRSSAGQIQPQQPHQDNHQSSSASSSSAVDNLVNTIQIQGPKNNQYHR